MFDVALDFNGSFGSVGLHNAFDFQKMIVDGRVTLIHFGGVLEISCGFEYIEFKEELFEGRETD